MIVKSITSLLMFIFGAFISYKIGRYIYLQRGKSMLVEAVPMVIGLILMFLTQTGDNIRYMSVFQAGAAGFSLGMIIMGIDLIWIL